MNDTTPLTMKDRLAQAILGAATGTFYGVFIAIVAYAISEREPGAIIFSAATVFCILGFFFGNFVFDALLALINFVFGVMIGLSDRWDWLRRDRTPHGTMRAFLLLGFGTGLVIIFANWY